MECYVSLSPALPALHLTIIKMSESLHGICIDLRQNVDIRYFRPVVLNKYQECENQVSPLPPPPLLAPLLSPLLRGSITWWPSLSVTSAPVKRVLAPLYRLSTFLELRI